MESLALHGLDVEDHGDEVRERGEVDTQETRQVAVAQFSKVVRDKVLVNTFTQLITAMRIRTLSYFDFAILKLQRFSCTLSLYIVYYK